MTIPKRYEDLTVEQFQKLEALKSIKDMDKIDLACNRLSILTGKSISYIESLHPTKVYSMLLDALYLTEPLTQMACPDSFWMGGKKFKYIKEVHSYTTAQQKDFVSFLKQHDNDYVKCLPELMAICHLEFGLKGWHYNQGNHFKNVELFKKAKLKDCLGAVFFYSNYSTTYNKALNHCLESQIEVIQKELLSDKDFQSFLKTLDGSTPLVNALRIAD